jgi:uncharacterized protein (TIGR02118 family)
MHKLVILINEPADPDHFEAGWPKFLHWAEQMPGLRREVTSRVAQTIYGAFSYFLVHELHFDTPQEAHQALRSQAGQAAGQTLQALTQGQVILFFADHLEDSLENIQSDKIGSSDS